MKINNIVLLVIAVLLIHSPLNGAVESEDFVNTRAKLLSHIISKQLSKQHYSHKLINDDLSKDAFDLYIKQVDPQKRFFLQEDYESLKDFALKLDDEMRGGFIQFPIVAEKIIRERVKEIQEIVNEIATIEFDFNKQEHIEIDSKKLTFCEDKAELKDRWRRTIKYQIISQYLDQLEINKEKEILLENSTQEKEDKDPRVVAKEKVLKSTRNLLGRILKRESKDQFDRYFSIIAKAFDPHSTFMPPTQKEDFDIHMRGSLEGIGAVLQEDDGFIKVMRVIPGGAAYRQKQLSAEDVILMVAQADADPVDITDMRIRDAVRLIRGNKGTQVRLTVKKTDGSIMIIPIIRDVVQLEETFVKSTVINGKNNEKFGYLKIPSFYRDFQGTRFGGNGRNVTDDVKKSLEELNTKNIKGLLIDLRNNGGGALVDAVKIAGLFIEKGPIVQIKTSDNKAEVLHDYDAEVYYKGPVIILINRFSASASEILAGALQDYNRALIVGSDHSYGKGTVQTLLNLDNNLPFFKYNMSKYKPLGALKVTTQKFYRVNGESTQHRGVVPDIILPDRFKYTEAGEQYIENSMPWDKIDPIEHAKWGNSKFNISSLKFLSGKRITADEKFTNIVKESKEGKKRMEQTYVAIDLKSVKEERERLKKFRDENDPAVFGHGTKTTKSNDDDDKELSKEEKKQKLKEQLQDDPYVVESLFLLRDST